MTTPTYDRSSQDVGNITSLEHVNVCVPDVETAMLFYVQALGLTRDPYVGLGPDLLWVNVGEQQFHLPSGEPQVLRGSVEVVFPNLLAVRERLEHVAPRLSETRFEFRSTENHLEVRGPWGNRFRCHQAMAGERMQLGIRTVDLDVPVGTAGGIGRFYTEVIGVDATVADGSCEVCVGPGQTMRFNESTDGTAYDGHHIAVYVADFSGPHGRLAERGLIVEESNEQQYRFTRIVDPDSGADLFELEHEVRSLTHPLHRRPLTNRNPE